MAELLFDFQVCDCQRCNAGERNNGWTPRFECGCDEDICPECGCCMLCCDGHDEDDYFIGQGDDEL